MYKKPEMEMVLFDLQDIITFSTGEENVDGEGNILPGVGEETAPEY